MTLNPSEVRKIPHEGPRIETGALQVGDDWPGLFIRGDDACDIAIKIGSLEDFLNKLPDKVKVDEGGVELALAWMVLRNLRDEILNNVRVHSNADGGKDSPGAIG